MALFSKAGKIARQISISQKHVNYEIAASKPSMLQMIRSMTVPHGYKEVNLRSYFNSIRPPTRSTYGFRVGKCVVLEFPKITHIQNFFYLPPKHLRVQRGGRNARAGAKGKGKAKTNFWGFRKVPPVRSLVERRVLKGQGKGKSEKSRLKDGDKLNETRIWPAKKQDYGLHMKNLSKLVLVSGASKHPKHTGAVNDLEYLLENDYSFRRTKLFKFLAKSKSRSDDPAINLLKKFLPARNQSLNYLVLQYLLTSKNKIHFDHIQVLKHFLAPRVGEPSTNGEANAQERNSA